MIIIFSKRFKKSFSKLEGRVQNKFEERLNIFSTDRFHPVLNNHSLHREYGGCRSINITGDIRAVYEDLEEGISFLDIGTHSQLYEG